MIKETSLKLAPHLIRPFLTEEKKITIRYGERYFEKEITIADTLVMVDSVKHYPLDEVPLADLLDDGFRTFREAYESLRNFYPDITPESTMTVVRFHIKPQKILLEMENTHLRQTNRELLELIEDLRSGAAHQEYE